MGRMGPARLALDDGLTWLEKVLRESLEEPSGDGTLEDISEDVLGPHRPFPLAMPGASVVHPQTF
jgi:hypothetical protein